MVIRYVIVMTGGSTQTIVERLVFVWWMAAVVEGGV
jgi:hypothetical protein